MLEDLPDDLAPPCVCIDHSVYFVNELLRQSMGQYFIPKKFFQAQMSMQGAVQPTLLALGHEVSKTLVSFSLSSLGQRSFISSSQEGFAVDQEMVVVPVLTFLNTFVDLQHQDGVSSIKFTG